MKLKVNNNTHAIPDSWEDATVTQAYQAVLASTLKDPTAALLAMWCERSSLLLPQIAGDVLIRLYQLIEWAIDSPMLYNPVQLVYKQLDRYNFAQITAYQYAMIEETLTEISQGKNTSRDLIPLLANGAKLPLTEPELLILTKYAADTVAQIREDYSLAFSAGAGARTEGADFGWSGVFLSVAESRVFGDLHQVQNTKIHDLLNYLAYCRDRDNRREQLSKD